jgi:hypothetical protein
MVASIFRIYFARNIFVNELSLQKKVYLNSATLPKDFSATFKPYHPTVW